MKEVNKQEIAERAIAFVKEVKGAATNDQVNRMFQIHNDWFPIKENGKSCSSCRARVFQKVKNIAAHWESILAISKEQQERFSQQEKDNLAKEAEDQAFRFNQIAKLPRKERDLINFIDRVPNFKVMSEEDRLFLMLTNNEMFPKLIETNRSCSACRGRMWRRLDEAARTIRKEHKIKPSNA